RRRRSSLRSSACGLRGGWGAAYPRPAVAWDGSGRRRVPGAPRPAPVARAGRLAQRPAGVAAERPVPGVVEAAGRPLAAGQLVAPVDAGGRLGDRDRHQDRRREPGRHPVGRRRPRLAPGPRATTVGDRQHAQVAARDGVVPVADRPARLAGRLGPDRSHSEMTRRVRHLYVAVLEKSIPTPGVYPPVQMTPHAGVDGYPTRLYQGSVMYSSGSRSPQSSAADPSAQETPVPGRLPPAQFGTYGPTGVPPGRQFGVVIWMPVFESKM